MNRATKFLWLAFAIVVPLGLLWQFYPLSDASARLNSFPHKSATVDSQDVPLTPAEASIFSGVTVLKRLAQVGNDQAIVTVIDGTKNRHAVHDPVFCFRGAGWEVSSQETVPMGNGEARLVHLKQNNEVAEALYWFSDGREQFDRPLLYWWKTALRRLTFGSSGNEPVLVVLTSTDSGLPNWQNLLKQWPELQTL
jgi:hypothetical protein